jgi:hypothetical protein
MPATTAQEMPAFVAWITTYGSMFGFFFQLAWWTLTGIAAIWAAATFKRYVDMRSAALKAEGVAVAGGKSAKVKAESGSTADDKSDEKVDVDKFVD